MKWLNVTLYMLLVHFFFILAYTKRSTHKYNDSIC